jgi:hypothetical protein
MKCLCITGVTPLILDPMATLFLQAGMQAAKAPTGGDQPDIHQWHGLLESASTHAATDPPTDAESSPEHPQTLGRMWEQLAAQIFFANVGSPLWGWADARSVQWLDFWAAFEPNIYFVLVSSPPEYLLAHTLEKDAPHGSLQSMLQTWQIQHERMLRFYHQNSRRAVLIDVRSALMHPQALIDHCRRAWRLPLHALKDGRVGKIEVPATARYVAQRLRGEQPEIDAVYRELLASQTPIAEGDALLEDTPTGPDALIQDYRRLQSRIAEIQREGQRQAAEQKKQIDALTQARDQQAKLAAERHKQIDDLNHATAALEQEKTTISSRLEELQRHHNDLKEENELLLLQLHQAQEELEQHFLQGQQLQAQVTSLTHERDQLTAQAAEQKKQIDALTQARDQQAKLAAERHKQIDALNHATAALEQEKTTISSSLEELQRHHNDLKEENELLLLQLHQVQEELEHYFLRHQEAQNQLQEAKHQMQADEARWLGVLTRHPELLDYQSVQLAPDSSAPQRTHWRFEQLLIGGRFFPQLEFQTIAEADGLAIRFARATAPFVRWPAPGAAHLELLAHASAEEPEAQRDLLVSVAASDWPWMKALPRLVQQVLSRPQDCAVPDTLDTDAIGRGSQRLEAILAEFPAALRYDGIRLKREQVNPDYEHLWLALENLTLDERHWPALEFRISCANVRPGVFGTHPKLEFPEQGAATVLEGWFAESADDFGVKYELRFALPEAMDVAVYRKLTAADRRLMHALIDRLEPLLDALASEGVSLQRSMDDWRELVRTIHRIYHTVTSQLQPTLEG